MKTNVNMYRGNLLAGTLAALLAAPISLVKASETKSGNEAVLDAFAQRAGDQAPQLARDSDGSVRLEWRTAVTVERYQNDITPPPGSGNLTTPFGTGTFNKWTASTEIKLLEQSGGQTFLRGNFTGSNDRAALSRYNQQITQLQLGRQAGGFNATAGDVMAGF